MPSASAQASCPRAACSFWFRFVKVWQTIRITPIETYKAVTVTSRVAQDVVSSMVTDSVQQARHALVEARAVADRNRAKAELLEDRPCPDVSLPGYTLPPKLP